MIGKIIQWDGEQGKLCWSATQQMFNFIKENCIGEIALGDKVSFQSNGLLGERTQAVDVTKLD